MIKKILLSVFIPLLISSSVFADTDEKLDLPRIEASKERVLDQRQNYFLTSTDYRMTPKVNPVTGEYCEEEIDLVVAGSQPLSVRRFYNSSAPYDPRCATWRYNPESFFVANFEWGGQEIFASIGDGDGSACSLKRSSHNHTTFDFEVPKSFLAFQPDGQSHPLNTQINYWKQGDPKDKHRYEYRGTITDGSGRVRTFASPMHRWTDYVHWREKKGSWLTGWSEALWRIRANTWTPYHIPITEEKLPNGNIIIYTYTQWKKEKQNYPLPRLLSSITAYNADKTKTLGSIQLHYHRAKQDEVAGIQITGSDERIACIQHAGKSPINLASSQSPGQPQTTYSYVNRSLTKISKPEGRLLTTEYNSDGKVSAQYAPVGPNGEMHAIGRYSYSSHMTQVIDAEDNRVDYHFDDNRRLKCIAYLRNYRVYRQEHFQSDPNTGNLTRRTIGDSNNTPLQIIAYTYDKNHNPIEERIGNNNDWRIITRTFSDDGLNLKLTETDRGNKLIRYTYIPGTNLLSSEFSYEENTIRKRTFHTYDDCAICIQTISDDGCTENSQNLCDVTYRTITYITPKYSTPCFGLPEIVEEKTIDSSGKEILLSKIVYTYTPFGEILQEDHYDANGAFRYSLYNTYDEQERLISKTDPLGEKTTYTYDANHNITTITGPRPDQYREITYDQANRPIRIASWQTDGTILITEKQYNKLGQVISETDPCGQTTRFEYDEFGHITAVRHPDGAIERKEYDILGNVTKETDPEGYETTKTYNPFGQSTSIHYPDGSEERFTYNPTGTIQIHTDKNGATTHYTYDIFDHPICKETYSSTGQLLKRITSTWTPFHKLSETEDDLTTHYNYDFSGRKTAEQQAYRQTEYHYDPLNRLACTQAEKTHQITEYDLCDRPIQVRAENEGLVQKQEAYAYDETGNCTHTITSQGTKKTRYTTDGKPLSITDLLGQTTLFSYSYQDTCIKTTTNPKGIQTITTHDARGREVLCIKKNPYGDIIQQSETRYNKNGNPIQVTHTIFSGTAPIRTVTHTWEYGPLGRLENFLEAGEKQTRYAYDSKGRLQTIIKPDGSRLIHTYDDLGRLVRYHSHDFDYSYTYDSRDRVISVTDQNCTLRTYDPLGNTLRETLANGLTLSKTYNTQGRMVTCTLPDTSQITYAYDGAYLHTISRNGHTHIYSARNLEGQIICAQTPVGEIHINRDPLGRCTRFLAPHYSAQDYTYDPVGNLLSYTHQDQAGQAKHHYTYDDLDQLIQEDGCTYHYDSIQNRLQKEAYTYALNTLSQVISDGETNYIYDPCGNLISDGTRTYTYDTLDRLITVEQKEHKIEYTYDPFHRRLSKTTYHNGHKLQTIRYLWDGKHEIGSVDEQNKILELRVLGEGLGAEIGAAVLYELQDQTYVPIHDHRGSVVALIDLPTQTPIEHYRYSAFGEEETGNTLSAWRFSSKRTDEATGLIYFGRRYYNPTLGRWITQDPQGFEDGPNLYAYVHNNPLTEIDLYGLWSLGQALGGLSRMAFKSLEWTGANLLPLPYVRNAIESIGRWGAGGGFRGPSRYRTGQSEIITIPGKTVSGHSYTHGNGMLTRKEDAIKQAEYISQTHGNLQVDLLYHGTEGLVMDLIGCGLSKLGIPTGYNKMCASYYTDKLRDDPTHRFTSSVHSRGGIQMMNTGRLLSPDQRQQIDVISYGSATLIPKGYFRSAKNNLSALDVVTMTNPLAFCMGVMGQHYDVNVLTPSTGCPLKAHGFLEETYAKEIKKRGDEFKLLYFNE